jgi:uncharacterized membrane protein HdeD (DUF308 family)
MEQTLSRGRGACAVRGVAALLFAVLALAWPGLTMTILVLAFGTYAIADGIFTLGTLADHRERKWLTALEGLFSVAAGLAVLLAPAMATRLAFVGIGFWSLITGAMQLLEAPGLHVETSAELALGASGIIRMFLGVVLLARPHAGLRALVVLVALYALMEGVLMLGVAITGKPREPMRAQPA